MTRRIFIGTSGWHYRHWKGLFYPDDLANRELLKYYARFFRCVEINNSFYRLPTRKVLEEWSNSVPKDFIFSVKASRFITHMKKLKDPEQPLDRLFDRITALEKHLGPVLFQLPPNWHRNVDRLKVFLDRLSPKFKYTFEFRDPSWFDDEVLELLSHNNVAFCIYQLGEFESPRHVTADFVYIRLHGPSGSYAGRYSRQALSGWAGAISAWVRQKKSVYCFFDNDQAGYAVLNAHELLEMLSSQGA